MIVIIYTVTYWGMIILTLDIRLFAHVSDGHLVCVELPFAITSNYVKYYHVYRACS